MPIDVNRPHDPQPVLVGASLVLVLGLLAGLAAAASPELAFTWVRTGDVVHDAGVSAGLAWGDFDGDLDPDLYIANWYDQSNLLYRNEGDGSFTRLSSGAVTSDAAYSSGPAWGDYDSDGDLDLFVANQRNQHNSLYRNDGDTGFTKISEGDIVSDFGDSYSAAWADYDNDGLLDLHVSNSGQPDFLYHNEGTAGFRRITSGPLVTETAASYGASWGDMDNDGDADLFIATAAEEPNRLLRNNGDGTFSTIDDSPVTADPMLSTGGAWGDFDNDGDLDLFVANARYFIYGLPDALYLNDGSGGFTAVEDSVVVTAEAASAAASWADVDLDGDLDLLVVHYADGNSLFPTDGGGGFSEYQELIPIGISGVSAGHGWADIDLDGDLDLALANWENQDNNLYTGDGNGNHWLCVRLRGVESNRSGIGARVLVTTRHEGKPARQRRDITAGVSFRSQDPATAHFGLGTVDRIEALRVEWPSGAVDELQDVAADRLLVITEGLGVSDERAPVVLPPPVADQLYDVYLSQGAEAARERYCALRDTSPDAFDYSPKGLSPLVGRLYAEGRIDEVLAVVKLAVEAFPDSTDALERLANIGSFLGRSQEVRSAYEQLEALLASDAELEDERRQSLENQVGYQRKHGVLQEPATD